MEGGGLDKTGGIEKKSREGGYIYPPLSTKRSGKGGLTVVANLMFEVGLGRKKRNANFNK